MNTKKSKSVVRDVLLSALLCACFLVFPFRVQAETFVNPLTNPTPVECLFNWAENTYPDLLAPARSPTQFWTVYSYRYYPVTNAYLGVNSVNNHVYYLGPEGVLQDVGPLADWTPKAGCPVPQPSPAECLFNWAEHNYPDLFAPIGSPWAVASIDWTYRYYALTNAYLGIQSADNHVYYLGPEGLSQDVGPLTDWTPKASCTPPVANAGPDQTATIGATVTLDGSASTDLDGNLITYHWTLTEKPAGSQTGLSNPNALHPTLAIDKPGTYQISLVVNDGQFDSGPATVTINTQNSKPVAKAGAAQSGKVGDTLALDGSASHDVDGDTLTYHWTLPATPQNSNAQLNNPDTVNPSLTLDQPGSYTAQLIVNDGKAGSEPATVVLGTVNSRPVAKAGPAQSILLTSPATSVLLDGSGSSDADSDLLSFSWALISKPAGSQSVLLDPLAPLARFTPDFIGDYVAQLIVNDGHVHSDPNTAQITVLAQPQNHSPQISTSPPLTATVGANYSYAVDATDSDNDTLSYSLSVFPTGMTITAQSGLISWTPGAGQTGPQAVTVHVTDGKGGSDNQSFTVTAAAAGQITVPDLGNLSRATAESAIQQAKLNLGTLSFEHNAKADGSVINQSPAANSSVAEGATVNLTISLGPNQNLAPNPETVASRLDSTVATTTFAATGFLYSGPNPIQTGVQSGAIEAKRAAVIRGKVLDRQNNPLSGVTISLLDHPEFGQTLSRANGLFDLAVNGGGYLTVNYRKDGYLPAQRQVNVPWQDYAPIDDVVLIQLDSRVTGVNLTNTAPAQVARGNPVTDKDGTRQTTILFPAGTTATMTMADGSLVALPGTVLVRATEYTVGDNGPAAMPAGLPATSGYTYAVEYSVDEAQAAGATEVTFNQPVISYNENFLNFPVGNTVPAGYYDRKKGHWIPQASGRVIKISAINNATADLIINTTNVAATDTELTALGVTREERRQLAALYPVGQTLWRVPQNHFSPWDLNWSQQQPPDANPPNQPPPSGGGNNNNPNKPCKKPGCIIGIEGQTLGEELDVTGTPYFLRYNSDRQQGRTASNTLTIPLIGATLSPSLKRIDLTVRIAGQLHPFSFPAQANQSTPFTWDGKDVYGRSLEGGQPAFIDLGYVYNATYEQTSAFGQSGSGVQISGDESRNEVTLHQTHTVTLGDYDARKESLGGWTLNAHHVYDPLGRVLYQGDGKRRSVEGLSNIITTAVNPQPGNFSTLGSLAVGSDGSFYYAIRAQIHKIDPNGNRTVIGGTGVNGFSGDGGLAVNAQISFSAHHLSLAADGSLIFSDGSNWVRRIDTNGIITTIAGSGLPNWTVGSIPPEGIPGSEFPLVDPVARPAPDGSVYIANSGLNLLRLGTDGRLRVVSIDFSAADAGPNDRNFGIADFAVGLDGTVYLTDTHLVLGNYLIRKITPDGKIHVIAGTNQGGSSGDGGPALAATIFPSINGGIAVSPAGNVYFTEGDSVIRKISSDGIITQFAGNRSNEYTGDGGPANQASIAYAPALAFSPDGALYMADNHVIRRVGLPLQGYDAGNLSIPSEEGSELFVFDATGKHLRTLNTLTGATLLSFAYDNAGRLITLTDGDNNVTTIERDSFGNPTGIVSPFNQRTQLSVNGNGYFSSITNPANETERFTYSGKGLLLSKTDPGNNPTTFAYDDSGRLISDKDALNSLQTLAKSGTGNDYTVQHQSALGRKADYQVQVAMDGSLTRIVTATDGTKTQSTEGANGINQTSDAEGTTTTETVTGDPRWKMQSPYAKTATLSTGGLTATVGNSIVTSLSDPANLLSLSTLTETHTINNRSYLSQYTATNKTLTETSPLGRIAKTQIDNQGRPVSKQLAGLFDTQLTYDSRGRLSAIATGTDTDQRSTTIRYNAAGYVADITDALGRIQAYEYDAAGRTTRQTLTDGRQIVYGYDALGNLTAITPPGRPQHSFTYNALSQNDAYSPPVVSNGGSTHYAYNLDKQLTQITRPDTQTLSMVYDTAGRIDTLKTPLGDYGYDYNLTTGQLSQLTSPIGGKLDLSYSGTLLTGVTFSGEIAGSIAYGYDNDFRLSEVSVNAANPISYRYDNDSLLTQAGDLQFSRNSQNGLLTGSTLGVVTDSLTYNGFAETTDYQAKINSDNTYKDEYSYDKLGRITRKIETLFDTAPITYTYSYDTAGRLSKVTKGSAETSYGYDSNGNRMTLNGTTVASYDDQDRLVNYNGVSYTYTANGELLSKTSGGSTTNYHYDVLGNLRQVSFANGDQVDYAIDALDRRVGRKALINGVTTEQRFLYQDGLKIIAELDGSNNVVSRFVYGSRINVPDYMIKDGNTYRLITDHLGSPRVVIDTASGAIVQRIDYDVWGRVLSDSNPGFQPFGFAGGLYDRHTGLVRFGARDYEAEIGKWAAKDPILFGGGDASLYGYSLSDPVNLSDPTGLDSILGQPIIDKAKDIAFEKTIQGIENTNPGVGRRVRQVSNIPKDIHDATIKPVVDRINHGVRTKLVNPVFPATGREIQKKVTEVKKLVEQIPETNPIIRNADRAAQGVGRAVGLWAKDLGCK